MGGSSKYALEILIEDLGFGLGVRVVSSIFGDYIGTGLGFGAVFK